MNKGNVILPNHLILAALGIVVLVSAFACSTKPAEVAQSQIDQGPSWFINPPEDNDEFLYAVAVQSSSRQNIAKDRAVIDAKRALSAKLGEKVEALQKLFEEEVISGQDGNYSSGFTNATQIIVSQELTGASIDEQYFAPTATGGFTAYILMKLPVGDARRMLDNALSQDEELYVRFKESKAFEELQNNLERLGLDQ